MVHNSIVSRFFSFLRFIDVHCPRRKRNFNSWKNEKKETKNLCAKFHQLVFCFLIEQKNVVVLVLRSSSIFVFVLGGRTEWPRAKWPFHLFQQKAKFVLPILFTYSTQQKTRSANNGNEILKINFFQSRSSEFSVVDCGNGITAKQKGH